MQHFSNQRGFVLILFLWILALLSMLALGIAVRARLATKIQLYQLKQTEMQYDFLSAINLARFFIDSDPTVDMDSPQDPWFGIPNDFKTMAIADRFELEISDEESKIDLNKASWHLLAEMFKMIKNKYKLDKLDPNDVADGILKWRGTITEAGDAKLGEMYKQAPFESLSELLLLPELAQAGPASVVLNQYFTVFSSFEDARLRININTVQPEILEVFINSLLEGSTDEDEDSATAPRIGNSARRELFEKINKFREKSAFQVTDLSAENFSRNLKLSTSMDMVVLVNELLQNVTVNSKAFRVRARSKLMKNEKWVMESVIGPSNYRRAGIALEQPGKVFGHASVSNIPLQSEMQILSWWEGIKL